MTLAVCRLRRRTFRCRDTTDFDAVDVESQRNKCCFGKLQRVLHILGLYFKFPLQALRLVSARIGQVFEKRDAIGLHDLPRGIQLLVAIVASNEVAPVDLD